MRQQDSDNQRSPGPRGAGRHVELIDGTSAFVPDPLPPDLELRPLMSPLADAERVLGGLESIAGFIPDPGLFLTPLLRVEATLSSRIEGTQTTVEELFRAEMTPNAQTGDDAIEVRNYVDAMYLGMELLERRPLDLSFVRQLHARLMAGARGQDRGPGEFRQVQVFVGRRGRVGTAVSYVPPPHERVPELMADWAAYAARGDGLPHLIRCGLLHAQFELIHPFRDGNGRVGRLLMSLYLMAHGRPSQPLVLLSPYFEERRPEYYAHLRALSRTGDWGSWLVFFLEAVEEQSARATTVAQQIVALRQEQMRNLQAVRAPQSAFAVLELLFRSPYITIDRAARQAGCAYATAKRAMQCLEREGIVTEVTGRRRNKQYRAGPLLGLLEDMYPSA